MIRDEALSVTLNSPDNIKDRAIVALSKLLLHAEARTSELEQRRNYGT